MAWLLDSLRAAGAQDQVTALLARDPAAHVSLDDPFGVAMLRETGAQDQVTLLVDRLPSEGFLRTEKIETISRGIGSAGTPMGAQPSHGTGKIWIDLSGLGNT